MVNYSYAELVSRNWGFLADEEQEKIKKARILLAGCGLGSSIATLAARTGFTKFIVADGDKVEINNLNRQYFRLDHIGRNKAEVTAELIAEINPEAEVEVLPYFITEKDAPALAARAELIVNMVDPGPVIFALNQATKSKDKLVLFPLDIGFGGVTLAFTSESATIEEMVGRDVAEGEYFIRLVMKLAPYIPYISAYIDKFAGVMDDIVQGVHPGPQLGIAVNIASALTVTAMIKWMLGLPLKVAPEPLFLDSWHITDDK